MKLPSLRNIFRFLVCAIISAYSLLLVIFNFGPAERMLTQFIERELSNKLHTEVAIGNIQVGLFNRIILNDVMIKDLQHKEMLKANVVSAKIELRSLLKEQLSLRTVSLLDANILLYKQRADSAANYQFVIDAFASKDKKKKSELNLRINSIILRRVNASYDALYRAQTPGKLNTSHLNIHNLNANVSLKSISPDSLNLRVRSLAFYEQSGVCLKNLHFKISANRTNAHIEDFTLDMPQTHFAQGDLLATYDVRHDFSQLLSTLRIGATIENLQIGSNDLHPFVKLPKDLNQTLRLSTTLLLTPRKVQFNQLTIDNADHSLQIKADATLKRKNKNISSISLTIKQLDVKSKLAQQLAPMTKMSNKTLAMTERMGYVKAKGSFDYSMKDKKGVVTIIAHTAIGDVAADGHIDNKKLNAKVRLLHVQPDVLLNQPHLPTKVTLYANVMADLGHAEGPMIKSKGDINSFAYNNQNFSNIKYEVNYLPNHIGVKVNSMNAVADFTAQCWATLKQKRLSAVNINAHVKQLRPAELNIGRTLGQANFSGTLKVDLHHLDSSLPLGSINVNDFSMAQGPHGNYELKNFALTLNDMGNSRQQLHVKSDFIDTDIEGPLSPQILECGIRSLLHRCLPGLTAAPRQMIGNNAEWNIHAQVKKTDVLHHLLGMNVELTSPLYVAGTLNAGSGRTSLSVFTDEVSYNNLHIKRPSIYINGANDQYRCLAQFHKVLSGRDYSVVADLSTNEGQLTSQLSWSGTNDKSYNGCFESLTRFMPTPQHKGVNFNMQIRPTQFALADTTWNIASGQLSYINNQLAFKGVELSHANQMLRIDGRLAPHQNDSIVAQLHHIDVDYILGLVDFDAVAFGGQASGQAIFTQQGSTPQLHAHLDIPNFTFNHGVMGAASINANWNKHDNRINLDADMRLPGTPNYGTKVDGYVSLAEKGLSLNIDVDHTRLDFLRRYIDGIFGDFNGIATGNVCLYGPFKKLDFKGEVMADCSAKVLSTGVNYKVNQGKVTFAPGVFEFHNFALSDHRGGSGTASGALRHTHLKKLNYTFDITANNLLCYDQPRQPELPFYSTMVGSGRVQLNGWPNHFTADINVTPNAPTLFVYDLDSQSALSKDDRMIRFHALRGDALPWGMDSTLNTPHDATEALTQTTNKENDEPGTEMVLNFNMNLTPQAKIRIITDNRSGDAITAYGQGPLRATWHSKGGFDMYGVYTLSRGEYNISLQDIIRKNLMLQAGSSITFAGDPLNADLALKALYTVNGVSLNDLNYGAGFSNKTVRADCILNITGKARAPQVNFDLDLHNISEDEKQMVRQLISTDEDMNKQVMCLLGVGRFLTTGQTVSTSGNSTSQQQSSAAMRSFLSTTLTGQLNAAISSILGSQSKWTFGTNFMPGTEGWNKMEVDGLLQGRLLNDRLLINGNFGYRDNPYYASNFIGDFDIRYLLTPRGSVSLRAYSETNDRYFTKSSLTTQGVGIMLQREFTRLRDLFRKKRTKK